MPSSKPSVDALEQIHCQGIEFALNAMQLGARSHPMCTVPDGIMKYFADNHSAISQMFSAILDASARYAHEHHLKSYELMPFYAKLKGCTLPTHELAWRTIRQHFVKLEPTIGDEDLQAFASRFIIELERLADPPEISPQSLHLNI